MDGQLLGSCSKERRFSVATLIPGQGEWAESTSSILTRLRRSPLPDRGFQLWMPGWTWLQGGGGNSLSLPPSPSPHPSSFLLPLPALCLPPSFSSEAVESPRSSELRAPCSQSRLELNCASGGSCNPGPGAASPGLSPGRRGQPPRPWFGTEPRRGAGEPESRAGGPAQRPGESGSRTAEGRETAASRGQRAECRERPGSAEGAARPEPSSPPGTAAGGGARTQGGHESGATPQPTAGGVPPPSPAAPALRAGQLRRGGM